MCFYLCLFYVMYVFCLIGAAKDGEIDCKNQSCLYFFNVNVANCVYAGNKWKKLMGDLPFC